MGRNSRNHRNLSGRLVLAGGSLATSIILVEILLRFSFLLPITAMGFVMRPDPVLDHSLRPGTMGRMRSDEYDVVYSINSTGQRDDEVEIPKPPGRRRILVLGDSFMEGYGVSKGEILSDRLEDLLGIEVVNGGVKSYSPLLEYLYLRHRGLALDPDQVLLFLDLSDPHNDRFYSRRLVRDEEGLPLMIRPREVRFGRLPSSLSAFLDRHSYIYMLLLNQALKRYPATREDIGYAGAANGGDILEAARDSIPDTEYLPLWDETFEYLGDINDLLSDSGIPWILISYPYAHEVSTDAWREGRTFHDFGPEIASDRPFRVLGDFADSEGIEYFSLLQAFRADSDPASLFYDYDGHWSPRGHDLAARAVADYLGEGS